MNIAWIQSKPLDHEKATKYLRHRLDSHRDPAAQLNADEFLFPFTADALAALYEPGTTTPRNASVHYPVGWLRRTLSTAFNDRLASYEAQHAHATPAALAAIDRTSTTLGRKEIVAVRQKMNRGG